jgi:hypothetical protein
MSETNQNNYAAYQEQLPALRSQYASGYYALFIGAVLVGAYASYPEALTEGYERAGKGAFFVKQIAAPNEDFDCVISPIIAF